MGEKKTEMRETAVPERGHRERLSRAQHGDGGSLRSCQVQLGDFAHLRGRGRHRFWDQREHNQAVSRMSDRLLRRAPPVSVEPLRPAGYWYRSKQREVEQMKLECRHDHEKNIRGSSLCSPLEALTVLPYLVLSASHIPTFQLTPLRVTHYLKVGGGRPCPGQVRLRGRPT